MDVNVIRDPHIAMHGLFDADASLTLYYDETNNIRKLVTRPDGLNVRGPKIFVLGGIAHRGSPRDLGFESLRAGLPLPKDVSELKFNQIGNGEFLDVLQSAKMETFLKWVTDQNLFVHFQALDVLYWSTVDIVDSILAETDYCRWQSSWIRCRSWKRRSRMFCSTASAISTSSASAS